MLLLLTTVISVYANDCHVSGKFRDLIDDMNGIAELLSYLDFATNTKINPDKCVFEFQGNTKGLYMCQINASTGLYVGTDKYLNIENIQIQGYTNSNIPSESTYDWGYVAAIAACPHLKLPDTLNMYTEAYKSGYFLNNEILMICSMHPDAEDIWIFSVSNMQN